jgi:protein-tyrosine phosphatase
MRPEIYWVTPHPQGRLAIVGRPRAGDWLSDEVAAWKADGITDVISLLEDHEVRDLELSEEAAVVIAAGMSFQRFPITDRGVPTSRHQTELLWNDLAAKVRGGRSVAVHCRAGIGRSGLVTAGVLMRLGMSPDEAWARISKARGIAVPDTPEQRHWVEAQAIGHRR